MRASTSVTLLGLSLMVAMPALSDDWPNFRGPRHDGVSREKQITFDWPKDGLKELWRREIGAGFSSFAIADGRVFTCGTEEQQQTLFCLDERTGGVQWTLRLEAQMTDPDPNLHGPRATPTVDGDHVYFLASLGRMVCLSSKTGNIVWEHLFKNKPHWGYAGSVLIDGDLAIVSAGGSDGSLVALNKLTGKPVWTCGDEATGYATPYPIAVEGKRYVCGFMANSVLIAERDTGRQALSVPWPSHSGVNVAGPLCHEDRLLVSTGYGFGAGLFKLRRDGDKLAVDELWKTLKLRNKFQTPILIDGHLYTSDETGLKCVEFATGTVVWQKRGIVHSPLIAVGDHLILLRETGELQLARASTSGFEISSETRLFEGSTRGLMQQITRQRQGKRCWTVPVVANGRLFARNHDTVVCLDLLKK
ncbi:MAG: PQQ-binding-like beta-propeller repeat protein [Planctomycetota bacterium]